MLCVSTIIRCDAMIQRNLRINRRIFRVFHTIIYRLVLRALEQLGEYLSFLTNHHITSPFNIRTIF